MWEWLSDSPIGAAFAGLGIGIVAMLYFLGVTVAPDDEEVREQLDETQPLPMMPNFDNADEAIAWHDAQAKHYKELKREKLEQSKLVELLETAVLQINELKQDVDDLRRERDEDKTDVSVVGDGVDVHDGEHASRSAGGYA
jgi:hypothetical protein